MSWKKTLALASEAWCTIPFRNRPKTVSDVLDDILFQFPACFALRTRWQDLEKALDPEASFIRERTITRVQDLVSKLNWFWAHYGDHLQGNAPLELSEQGSLPSIFHHFLSSAKDKATFSFPINFRDTFAAQIIARYNAGNLLAYRLLSSMTPMNDGYVKEINIHGTSVLAAVAYHESLGPSRSGTISMMFPIRTLIVRAGSKVQRMAAQKALLTWGKRRGVERLCNLESSTAAGDVKGMSFQYDKPEYDFAS